METGGVGNGHGDRLYYPSRLGTLAFLSIIYIICTRLAQSQNSRLHILRRPAELNRPLPIARRPAESDKAKHHSVPKRRFNSSVLSLTRAD